MDEGKPPKTWIHEAIDNARLDMLACDKCWGDPGNAVAFFRAMHEHIEHTPELKRMRDELS